MLYPFAHTELGVIILDEKELNEYTPENENIPEKDIEELLDWWYTKAETTEESTEEATEVSLDAFHFDEETVSTEEPMEEQETVSIRRSVHRSSKPGWQSTLLTYLHDLVYLLSGLILVFLLLFRVVVVSGTSMNNTLMDGDYLLLLSSTFYQDPQQGDIIVASKQSFDDGAPIVKRVIATEGQWVNIDFTNGIVYVGDTLDDMHPLDEPYTLTPTDNYEGTAFPVKVPEGCLFVLGDNRNGSKDSRHPEIGFIDKREVLGKVFFLLLPGTNEGEVVKDFDRIGVVG